MSTRSERYPQTDAVVAEFAGPVMVKNGRTYRLIRDQVGSVRLVVDVETGEIVQRLEYDSFGRVLSDTNPGFQPFGFGGGLYDPDTGLVRFGLRDYDPETGRWTNLDPIGFAAGFNLYTYCRNDPVNFADPWGMGEGRTSKKTWRQRIREFLWGKGVTSIGEGVAGLVAEQESGTVPQDPIDLRLLGAYVRAYTSKAGVGVSGGLFWQSVGISLNIKNGILDTGKALDLSWQPGSTFGGVSLDFTTNAEVNGAEFGGGYRYTGIGIEHEFAGQGTGKNQTAVNVHIGLSIPAKPFPVYFVSPDIWE